MKRCALTLLAACGSDPQPPDPAEVITTVTLTFSRAGGPDLVFEADDPDGDGGDPPIVDPLNLPPGMYTLSIGFENRLEDPPEIITGEVADEAEQHQVFIVGSGVDGPAVDSVSPAVIHAYADQDANGNPIGLENTIDARGGGGAFIVVLRHMPPVNGVPVKTAQTAEDARRDGLAALPGENDVNVLFSVSVN